MKNYNRSKIIKISCLVSILFLVYFILILPLFKSINNSYTAIQNEYEQFQTLLSQTQTQAENYSMYTSLKQQLKNIDQAIFLPNQELNLITFLENLAKENNLEQEISINNVKVKFNDIMETMNVSINLTGEFKNIINYINEVENQKTKFSLNSLDLKINDRSEELGVTIFYQTFWLKTDEKL